MPFMLVDDLLNGHRKAREAGLEAMGLWTMAGSHVAQQLSDGVVASYYVTSWPDGRLLAKRLVEAELWHEEGHDCPDCDQPPAGDWIFHQWLDRNPSREKVLARRAARKAAGQRGGLARAKAIGTANGEATALAPAKANAVATARNVATATAPATPFATSRGHTPSPSPRTTSVVTLVALLTSAGATGLTTTTIERWAATNAPDIDIEAETAAFLAKNAGKQLHDPRAAWQAWMRKARPGQARVPAGATTVGLPPAADAPRCDVEGHEHELAGHCRICAADALEGPPDVDPDQEGTT